MTIALFVLLTPLFALLVWQAAESGLDCARRTRRRADVPTAPVASRSAKPMARAGSR